MPNITVTPATLLTSAVTDYYHTIPAPPPPQPAPPTDAETRPHTDRMEPSPYPEVNDYEYCQAHAFAALFGWELRRFIIPENAGGLEPAAEIKVLFETPSFGCGASQLVVLPLHHILRVAGVLTSTDGTVTLPLSLLVSLRDVVYSAQDTCAREVDNVPPGARETLRYVRSNFNTVLIATNAIAALIDRWLAAPTSHGVTLTGRPVEVGLDWIPVAPTNEELP